MKTNIHFWLYLAQFPLEWEMIQTKFVEKIRTHVLYSIMFRENRAVCEIMWKNEVDPDRPQTTWCILDACWISKATDIHSEYVILIAFSLQQWLHDRAYTWRHTFVACLVSICECSFTDRNKTGKRLHNLMFLWPCIMNWSYKIPTWCT